MPAGPLPLRPQFTPAGGHGLPPAASGARGCLPSSPHPGLAPFCSLASAAPLRRLPPGAFSGESGALCLGGGGEDAGLERQRWADQGWGGKLLSQPLLSSVSPPTAAPDPTSQALQGPPSFPAHLPPLFLARVPLPLEISMPFKSRSSHLSKYLVVPGAETSRQGVVVVAGGGGAGPRPQSGGCPHRRAELPKHHRGPGLPQNDSGAGVGVGVGGGGAGRGRGPGRWLPLGAAQQGPLPTG